MKRVAPLLLVALAGCGGSAPKQPADKNADAAAYAAKIGAMGEGERNGVFLRAIRDANQPCQAVTGSVAAPPGWVATCDDNSHWMIVAGPGGSATVTRLNPNAPPNGA